MKRLLSIALLLGLIFAPAFAAGPPPPVPALPDTARITTYTPTASTGPFDVGFQLYGDSTDYGNWVEVWLNGVKLTAVTDYTLTSPTGQLNLIPRPVTDGRITLVSPATGTLQIVGARRPRRASVFTEGAGVTARDLNQVINDITAENRETWDKSARALLLPPGETLPVLPPSSQRLSKIMGFDPLGAFTLFSQPTYLLPATPINPDAFGADPTGITNSCSAFNQALAAAGASGAVQMTNSGRYRISACTITVPVGVTLQGAGGAAGVNNNNGPIFFNTIGSVLLLDPDSTISLHETSTLRDFRIFQGNISFPVFDPSSYAGTAITINGGPFPVGPMADVTLHNLLIVGFNQAVYANYAPRLIAENVNFDSVNGIRVTGNSGDPVKILHCEGWPYGTVDLAGIPGNRRSGTGFQFDGNADAGKVVNSLTFGYQVGYHTSVNGLVFINDGADNFNDGTATSSGFVIDGPAGYTELIGIQAVGQYNAIIINNSAATDTVNIQGGYIGAGVIGNGVVLTKGTLNVSGSTIGFAQNAGSGILLNGAGDEVLNIQGSQIGSGWQIAGINVTSGATNVKIADSNDFTNVGSVPAAITSTGITIASATNVLLPRSGKVANISGSTLITGIAGGYLGREITLNFTGTANVQSNSNLLLNGNFVPVAGSSLTLSAISDTKWVEVGRKDGIGFLGTSGTTFTLPAGSDTLMGLASVNTVTGAKSFNDTKLVLNGPSSGSTIFHAGNGFFDVSIPAANDTLVGKATTDIFTNKTFDTAGTGNSLSINGVGVTANTGTGAVARAVSPAFTTPSLGVAAATSINKLSITPPATGSTLTVADGKTLTANRSITLAGTDGTTWTGPSSNATLAALNIAGQTFTLPATFTGTTPGNGLFLNGNEFVSVTLTSPTFTNGFFFGLNGAGGVDMNNRENTTLNLLTNSTQRLSIAGGGTVTFAPTAPVVMQNTGASTSSSTGALTLSGGLGVAGASYFGAEVATGVTTVGSLPTCNAARKGARYFVTDANATTFLSAVAGGGSNNVPVVCDAASWKIGANDNLVVKVKAA